MNKDPFRYNEPDDKSSKYVHEPRDKHAEEHRRLNDMKPDKFMRSFDLEIIRKMLDNLFGRKNK